VFRTSFITAVIEFKRLDRSAVNTTTTTTTTIIIIIGIYSANKTNVNNVKN